MHPTIRAALGLAGLLLLPVRMPAQSPERPDAGAGSIAAPAPQVLVFPGANSRATWITVHRIAEAHPVSRGAGVRVGILDHSFGFDDHPDLYAGGQNFQTGHWGETFLGASHHGYWMALALREVAPEAEIYALNTYHAEPGLKVDAMIRAIDWAIERGLDVLTYSASRFPDELRPALDAAVERAHAAGIVTTFIHYPHPGNLLPGWIGPRTADDDRDPDLNILHYDYTVLFVDKHLSAEAGRARRPGDLPYFSMSSTSPVAAGLVALVRALDPALSPADCRRILQETARPVEFEGRVGPRVPDAAAAARRVAG